MGRRRSRQEGWAQGLGWGHGKTVQIKLQNLGWISWAPGTQGAGVGVMGQQEEGRLPGQGWGGWQGLSHTVHYGVCLSVRGALEVVDDALEQQSPEALLEALQDPVLALRGVRRDFAGWYLDQLSSDREQKAQVRLAYHLLLPLSDCRMGRASHLGVTSVNSLYPVSADYVFKWLSHPRASWTTLIRFCSLIISSDGGPRGSSIGSVRLPDF